jgi:hypothetical protein
MTRFAGMKNEEKSPSEVVARESFSGRARPFVVTSV